MYCLAAFSFYGIVGKSNCTVVVTLVVVDIPCQIEYRGDEMLLWPLTKKNTHTSIFSFEPTTTGTMVHIERIAPLVRVGSSMSPRQWYPRWVEEAGQLPPSSPQRREVWWLIGCGVDRRGLIMATACCGLSTGCICALRAGFGGGGWKGVLRRRWCLADGAAATGPGTGTGAMISGCAAGSTSDSWGCWSKRTVACCCCSRTSRCRCWEVSAFCSSQLHHRFNDFKTKCLHPEILCNHSILGLYYITWERIEEIKWIGFEKGGRNKKTVNDIAMWRWDNRRRVTQSWYLIFH